MTGQVIGLILGVLAVVAAAVAALHRWPALGAALLGDQPCPDQTPAGREMCWVTPCECPRDHPWQPW